MFRYVKHLIYLISCENLVGLVDNLCCNSSKISVFWQFISFLGRLFVLQFIQTIRGERMVYCKF